MFYVCRATASFFNCRYNRFYRAALTGFSRGGCFLSIVVGFIGALLGTWIARELNLNEFFVINIGDVAFPVLWAIIGAAIFTGILSLLSPKDRE